MHSRWFARILPRASNMARTHNFKAGQEVFFISNEISAVTGGNIYKAKIDSLHGDLLCFIKLEHAEHNSMSDIRLLYPTLDLAIEALIDYLQSYHSEIKND